MAFTFDEETRKISMPPGDTGNIWLEIDWPAMKAGDAVIFAIVSRREGDILLKAAEVEQDAESGLYRAHIRLCNHDTRDIEGGRKRQRNDYRSRICRGRERQRDIEIRRKTI